MGTRLKHTPSNRKGETQFCTWNEKTVVNSLILNEEKPAGSCKKHHRRRMLLNLVLSQKGHCKYSTSLPGSLFFPPPGDLSLSLSLAAEGEKKRDHGNEVDAHAVQW